VVRLPARVGRLDIGFLQSTLGCSYSVVRLLQREHVGEHSLSLTVLRRVLTLLRRVLTLLRRVLTVLRCVLTVLRRVLTVLWRVLTVLRCVLTVLRCVLTVLRRVLTVLRRSTPTFLLAAGVVRWFSVGTALFCQYD
jgi:hypothetical protein